jgi:hypothetical protein
MDWSLQRTVDGVPHLCVHLQISITAGPAPEAASHPWDVGWRSNPLCNAFRRALRFAFVGHSGLPRGPATFAQES